MTKTYVAYGLALALILFVVLSLFILPRRNDSLDWPGAASLDGRASGYEMVEKKGVGDDDSKTNTGAPSAPYATREAAKPSGQPELSPPVASGDPQTMESWQAARAAGFVHESPAQLVENLANYDDFTGAWVIGSYTLGSPGSEMRMLINLIRVRRLLEIGAEDPSMVTGLLRTALIDALEQWPPVLREKMYPTKPAEDRSEPDDFEKVLRRAIAATYLLGELKDYDALPLLNHAFMTQQGWVQSLERRWVEQAPVPPSMSLYAMHRLIARIPPDRVRPQAAAAHAAYLQFAAENIPDVIIVKGQSLKVDMIRYPPMSFRDGEDIQVGGYTKMNLTDRAWDWHARMAAFIELNFP